jgi:hypothetical protein
MDLMLKFQLKISIDTDDFEGAEALAYCRARRLILDVMEWRGLELKYEGCSFTPELDRQIEILRDNSRDMLKKLLTLKTE